MCNLPYVHMYFPGKTEYLTWNIQFQSLQLLLNTSYNIF